MHFLARRGTRVVGRIPAAVNHRFDEHHRVRIGSFGFFAREPDEQPALRLLDAAATWCAARSMEALRGPGGYRNATHERQGVLIDGVDEPPTVERTHNPPYHAQLLETWGLCKVMDHHAHRIVISSSVSDRLTRLARAARRRTGVETRPADPRRFSEEVATIVAIHNRAWSSNWRFLPITEDEAHDMAQRLRPIVDPGLVRFALLDGAPCAPARDATKDPAGATAQRAGPPARPPPSAEPCWPAPPAPPAPYVAPLASMLPARIVGPDSALWGAPGPCWGWSSPPPARSDPVRRATDPLEPGTAAGPLPERTRCWIRS